MNQGRTRAIAAGVAVAGVIILTTACGRSSATQDTGEIPRTAWDRKPDLTGVWEGTALGPEAYGLADLERLYQPGINAAAKMLTEKDDPANGCIPYGSPRHQAMGFPVQIIQSPIGVVMLTDRPHMFRYIPTDGRSHPPDIFPMNLGNPVGKWEADTLVVDVTSFIGRIWLAGGPQHALSGGTDGGWPTSESLHLVERWRLRDANTLEYQATVDDPGVLTQPWTTPTITYRRSTAGQIGEGICIPPEFDYEPPAVKKTE